MTPACEAARMSSFPALPDTTIMGKILNCSASRTSLTSSIASGSDNGKSAMSMSKADSWSAVRARSQSGATTASMFHFPSNFTRTSPIFGSVSISRKFIADVGEVCSVTGSLLFLLADSAGDQRFGPLGTDEIQAEQDLEFPRDDQVALPVFHGAGDGHTGVLDRD